MSANSPASLGPVSASPQYAVEGLLCLAGVTDADTVYDLGCNDGRVVIAAAIACGARGVGVEVEPGLAEKAYHNVVAAGVSSRVQIIQGDLMQADLREATVVFIYLLPKGLTQLSSKLEAELPAGARIVTYMFRIPGWAQHLKQVQGTSSGLAGKPDVSNVSRLYLYQLPGKACVPAGGTAGP
ncbi:hypothetical protein WJX72_011417 [[Myrmecia] bisecta]|uniref:Methyltransferase domain-containing protein n=1 Tax=[Myrmecia] bisecta TaxID=41462 RepID=A0AAW1PPY7_9CHLO